MENEKGVELSLIELQSLISTNVSHWVLISFRNNYALFSQTFDYSFHYLLTLIYFR